MELRAPRATDAAAVLDLIVARDVADLGRPDYTLEDVEADWAAPGIELGARRLARRGATAPRSATRCSTTAARR